VEIKSTSIDPKRWEDYKTKNIPFKNHICQLMVYIWHFNHLKYFDKPVERGVLAYVNLLIPPGSQDAEQEFLLEYQTYKEKTEALINSLTITRSTYITDKTKLQLPCGYEFCKECNDST
jgi:hypothetical protein